MRFGVRSHPRACLVAAACALQAACGGNTAAGTAPPDASGGSAATAGTGGASGFGGVLVDPRCETRDDGAEVLADNLVGVRDPRFDGTHLFHPFHDGDPAAGAYVTRILKVGLHVGAPVEELATREGTVRGFQLSDQHVWWAHSPAVDEQRPWDPFENTLYRVAKNGGLTDAMVSGFVLGISSSPRGLVILRMGQDRDMQSGKFQLLPWSGGAPTDLCEYNELSHVAANESVVAWLHREGIDTCPLRGDAPMPFRVMGTSDAATSLVIDSTHAYWSTFEAIYRIPLAGGERETLAIHPAPASPPNALVLDGEEVFFIQTGSRSIPGGSRIRRLPKTGGSPSEVVAPQKGDVMFFTLDATHIYWGEGYPVVCLKRMRR